MKAAIAAAVVLLLAVPEAARADFAAVDFRSKKDQFRDAKVVANASRDESWKKQWEAALDKQIGKDPEPVLNIYNTWTHEFVPLEVIAKADLPADCVDNFFRCHYTNNPTNMDPKLFQVLVAAARKFDATRINIVSGFRSPKYNLILRKKGREVARTSQHTLGKAVDFRIPGVPVPRLHVWAKAQKLGGVGVYHNSKFVHMDTGRVRYWTGR